MPDDGIIKQFIQTVLQNRLQPSAFSNYANSVGPYVTKLTPSQENKFQSWVATNKIPFDPGPNSDYDMRGYWQSTQGQPGVVSAFDGKPHFTDTFKTPYHETFSNESKYATPDAPKWVGDKLVDKYGRVIKDETPLPNASDLRKVLDAR